MIEGLGQIDHTISRAASVMDVLATVVSDVSFEFSRCKGAIAAARMYVSHQISAAQMVDFRRVPKSSTGRMRKPMNRPTELIYQSDDDNNQILWLAS